MLILFVGPQEGVGIRAWPAFNLRLPLFHDESDNGSDTITLKGHWQKIRQTKLFKNEIG